MQRRAGPILESVRLCATVRRLLRENRGQSLVEYTLLVAFICLASAGLFFQAGGSVKNIWSSAKTVIASPADHNGDGHPDDGAGPVR